MKMTRAIARQFPIGAELNGEGAHFRVWAPDCRSVWVEFESADRESLRLAAEDAGYFSGFAERIGAGDRYHFRLDDGDELLPDPASRYQPCGPRGPSELVDASRFPWRDTDWAGASIAGQVFYELHVGTFTPEELGRPQSANYMSWQSWALR